MKHVAASSRVTIAIVAVGIGLVGCGGSHPSSNNSAGKSTVTTSAATTTASGKPQSKVAPRTTVPGPNPTIAGYFRQNGITETPVHRGDPGAPTVNLPIPDGWADAGPDTPATAYWAIVATGPVAAKYTPSVVATLSKLGGDADPQKILELAPNDLKNLPGFTPKGNGSEDSLAGFPAYESGGTWVDNGQTKAVAEKTVVIEGKDDVDYLLQLNIDCLDSQVDQVLPVAITIDDKTTITP